jgi:hypothetical protein
MFLVVLVVRLVGRFIGLWQLGGFLVLVVRVIGRFIGLRRLRRFILLVIRFFEQLRRRL